MTIGSAIRTSLDKPILRRAMQVSWIGLIIFFAGYYLWGNWVTFQNYDWQLDWWWLLIAIAWAMVRRLLAGIRWLFIILDQKKWTWGEAFNHLGIYFISNLARYIPGSLWYAASRISLGKNKGTSTLRTSIGLLYEMGLNVWSGCLIGMYVATIVFTITGYFFYALVSLLIIGSFLMIHPKVVNPLLRYLLLAIKRPLAKVELRFAWMLRLWLISLAIWVAGGLNQFCLLKAMYPALSLEHLVGITSATALAWTVGFLAPWAPSGLGVRDGLLVWILELYVPTPLAVMSTVASRLVNIFEDFAWSAIVFPFFRK